MTEKNGLISAIENSCEVKRNEEGRVTGIRGQDPTSEYDVWVLGMSVEPYKRHLDPETQGQLLENDMNTSPVTVQVIICRQEIEGH